jgi:tRNA (guanine37-N1)-methyltransferase
MKIDILTLFPNMFVGPFTESMVKRAVNKKIVKIKIHNLRDWATDKHKIVDDRPYGGGKGMIMKVDVIGKAINQLKSEFLNSKSKTNQKSKIKNSKLHTKTILLSPQGKVFSQQTAQKLSRSKHLILICGHYEGFDERVRKLINMEISIGNYVLTGGELPAMIVTDTIVRLLPGVLDPEATNKESFSDGKTLDFPQYTRPENYQGMKVPKILLSGNHKKIDEWRKKKQKKLVT